METSNKIYGGGCHCGFIRYSISFDLSDPVGERCNCSSCQPRGYLILDIIPSSNFTLRSPTSLDDSELGKYRPMEDGSLHFYFCKKCGINCWYQGTERSGKEYVKINALTLDKGHELDFGKWRVDYWDGKGDNWKAGPSEKPYPGGSI